MPFLGATVTVIARQVMMASGASVARQVGILAPTVREPARHELTGDACLGMSWWLAVQC